MSSNLFKIFFSVQKYLCFFLDGVPSAAVKTVNDNRLEDEFGAKDYRNELEVKKDFESRPIWVVSTYIKIYN